jgi:predicted permease
MPTRPPSLATRILEAVLPADLRDDVCSNLDELYAGRVRRNGHRRADLWYWRQVVSFPLRLLVAGVAHRALASPRTSLLRSLQQDLRFAVRIHRVRPGAGLVAILSLAIGIGLNTAIFSVFDQVLLRPSPIPGLDRLVVLWEADRNTGTTREPGSLLDFLDYRRLARTLDGLGGMIATEVNLTPPGGDPLRLPAIRASADLLAIMGIDPVAGRAFSALDDGPGGPNVVLISEPLGRRLFGASPDTAIGREIRLDDAPYEVIGVVGRPADFGVRQVLGAAAYSRGFVDRARDTRVEVWIPLRASESLAPSTRGNHPVFMIGRRAVGTSLEAVRRETDALAASLEQQFPATNVARSANVEPLGDVIYDPSRPSLLTLIGAVTFLLLVACVNAAHLLLARGASRHQEIAVRRALGAGRWRIVRQFLVEALMLSSLACIAGVALAYAAVDWLAARGPAGVPGLQDVTVDVRVLGYALIVSVTVGVLFGIVPALQAIGVSPRAVLGLDTSRSGTAGRARRRAGSILVVAELALAVVLVTAAGLLIRSFAVLRGIDPGFSPSGVVKAEYQLPPSRYPANFAQWPDFKEMHAFNRALVERASALPGVASAAIASGHPLDLGFTSSFEIIGRPQEAGALPEISIRLVTPGYFETVGVPLLRGRLFHVSDALTSPAVALVNAAAVQRLFPGLDPIGQEMAMWGARRRIVGVVANERFHGLTAPPPIAVYYPLSQAPSAGGAGVLLVRSANGSTDAMAALLSHAIHDVDPTLAVFGVEPLDDTLSQSFSERRFTMSLLAVFAAIALLLAAVGIHGVLNLTVSDRIREIGIRIALGARPEWLRRRILGEGLMLGGLGLALGLGASLLLSRYLASLLFGVTRFDALTYVGVVACLLVATGTASYLPARRATGVAPNQALRS